MLKNFVAIIMVLFTIRIAAQDFDSLRIYINPGHGGHDSDDRHVVATDFWESEGNLSKGLYLRDILKSMNADVRMSRTQNRTQDDLPLSQIVEDANNFDADYFHSIHSNSYDGQTNYTLVLFQGFDNGPTYPEAKQMGSIISNEIYKAHRTSTHYNRGDFDFYGTGKPYLGVFKGLLMPGTLSEGSFHDYIPESWRLKDEAYLKHEAWAIARSFVQFYGLTPMPFGEIAGIVRDKDEPVSYFSINSADSKKPVNKLKVTLQPGNLVYNGDDFNNGFFMFDRLSPGNYKLIYEAEDYQPDSLTVTVVANKTVFADKYLSIVPNYNPPLVLQTVPLNADSTVSLSTKVNFTFSIPMNTSSVQNAFKIEPAVSGNFEWRDNNKELTFSPDSKLLANTTYSVTIDTTAETRFGIKLASPFLINFKTREKLKLISFYPKENQKEISTTVKIILDFDAPIDINSLGGNIFFKDAQNNDVSLLVDQDSFSKGKIIFWPANPLNNSSGYKIILNEGIKDEDGLTFGENLAITFYTEKEKYSNGTIIDSFENAGQWWQPEQSGSTNGIDSNQTKFTIVSNRKVSGSYSGKLIYNFTSDSGVCRLYNAAEPVVNGSSFNLWIFGDLSYNLLEFWFRDANGSNVPYFVDTLNWTGWKVKSINLADLNISGEIKFHSIVIKKAGNGSNEGVLFFDDAQTDIVVPVNEETNKLPVKFKLSQNYPNPFNPTTTIKYTIPTPPQPSPSQGEGVREGFLVSLKIYDVLGREVATLVNKKQKPGVYKVEFNASNLPSGVYLYRIKAGSFVQVRKMILLK